MKHFACSKAVTFSLTLAAFASSALAQHRTYAVNPDASEVKMTLKTNH